MARASGLKLTRFSVVGLREDEGGMFDSTAFEPSSGDPKSIPRVKPGAIVKISPGNRIQLLYRAFGSVASSNRFLRRSRANQVTLTDRRCMNFFVVGDYYVIETTRPEWQVSGFASDEGRSRGRCAKERRRSLRVDRCSGSLCLSRLTSLGGY